jgi:hypothetical protein
MTIAQDGQAAARIALVDALDVDKIRAALAYVAEHAPEIFDAATIGRDQRQHDRLPAAGSRFRCALNEPGRPCATHARVTITDALGDTARGCVRHAIDALDHIDGARVDWADTKGLDAGYEVTFQRWTAGPGGEYFADITSEMGSQWKGLGATPGEALRSVWPLGYDSGQGGCGHCGGLGCAVDGCKVCAAYTSRPGNGGCGVC